MVRVLSRARAGSAAGQSSRASLLRRAAFSALTFTLATATAHAVIVRGRLTDALGTPIPGGRVQLVEGGKAVAFGVADTQGNYEIDYDIAGRFTLVGLSPQYLPSVGIDFYAGAKDVLQQDVVLATNTVRQDISVSATGLPTPLPQLTAPVTVLPGELMSTDIGVNTELRQEPGAFVVQTGQTGGVTSLFLRGGNSTANLVMIDGIPADDIGGVFDYGTVSSTAIDRIEVYRGPDSAIYGTDAGAGVVAISTPRGSTPSPVVTYSGDAGNLFTWRNEVTAGGTLQKLDYYGAFSRFDTSNAIREDRYHAATSAANVGYDINGNTQVRFTIHNAVSATGLPGPQQFFGEPNTGKQADQDLYSGLTVENRYHEIWHNLLRYGIARKREQEHQYGQPGTPITLNAGTAYAYTEYFGPVVTIRGANGYSVTGQTDIYGSNSDQDSNRDQLYYQSDLEPSQHFNALFGFRYDRERGSFNNAAFGEAEQIQRTNYEYNLQFQGELWDRLFYSAGAALEKNHLYGIAGTPRLGLTYSAVRPTTKFFHGTRLRANAATGVQEPSLSLEFNSLYRELLAAGDTADIAQYHIGPQGAERSRTYDVGVDQNIVGEKLVLKAGYFHNVFDHQLEAVDAPTLDAVFGFNLNPTAGIYDAYVNSLAYRAQGIETELTWQPRPAFLLRGGYTYLDAYVLQSISTDVEGAAAGPVNPTFPNIAIGALGPLVGARPFRRAPHTGYFDAQYTHRKLNLALRGAMASRSDDSTYLEYSDTSGGNSLLLPNRDLDYGYVKLDLSLLYTLKHGFTWFGQVDNLLNDQHMGPIGYPSLPLTFRTGLKLRIGAQ